MTSKEVGGQGKVVFGTDGVRDRAGEGYLSAESVKKLIAATARTLEERAGFPDDFPAGRDRAVVITRDTRGSGQGLSQAVASEFSNAGYSVMDLGILPTPGAAWIAAAWKEVTLGVVISASHNPAEYNGIKFVAPSGAKISPDFERAVSAAYWRDERPRPAGAAAPIRDRSGEAFELYVDSLTRHARKPARLRGRRVALDCANGAAYRVAVEVFRRLGMLVDSMGTAPNGTNINEGCGALHPEGLARLVTEGGAAVGFCFDGDADRMIPVTAAGTVLDGDHVLYLAGRSYLRAGQLPGRTVVATTMSNIGLEIALRTQELRLLRTDVGDRNVYLAMVEGSHPVGGEQSGHIIFLDDARTGDGVLAAVRLLDLLEGDALDLAIEAAPVRRYPQLLRNVRVTSKPHFDDLPLVQEAVGRAESRLNGNGRIVLRYSGTEPLARVMIEGPDAATVEELVDGVCAAIRRSIPGSQ